MKNTPLFLEGGGGIDFWHTHFLSASTVIATSAKQPPVSHIELCTTFLGFLSFVWKWECDQKAAKRLFRSVPPPPLLDYFLFFHAQLNPDVNISTHTNTHTKIIIQKLTNKNCLCEWMDTNGCKARPHIRPPPPFTSILAMQCSLLYWLLFPAFFFFSFECGWVWNGQERRSMKAPRYHHGVKESHDRQTKGFETETMRLFSMVSLASRLSK